MRVLVVKTSSMGDIIHTLPALTDAVQAIPGIRFDWVVEEGFAEIPRWHAAVDKVIPVAIRRWRKQPLKTWKSGEWQAYKQALQARDYDFVIDAQGLIKSAFLVTRLAKGVTCGYDKASVTESLATSCYRNTYTVDRQQHAVERIRQLFALSLGYALPGEKGDFAIRQHFLQKAQDEQPYLVFLHSTTRADKHWPEAYWQQLIERAAGEEFRVKLPWVTAEELARAERLAADNPFVDILPKLNLHDVSAVIAGATACVSVDTGLSHMAAALDRPNITLFGPTDPGLVGGYGKNQLSLEAKMQPAVDVQIEPQVFAPLTADIVWQYLQETLRRSECQAGEA
ncbi:lipopolysaccharide heptosyltransferase RfaC [Aliamphritea spongicola]|uniref:lipopolysaccharide heptosyltransferase RfaC n=1 Tax=Aliamphritea spongicola TaxID=707589 RepID=UPI00196A45A8|nr:lipopolysaccharide heptosyltransferase RfaC [Aliamphritea spongicola]MBN3562401.1 lipopolysaccharide heptosyltransferase RfaC [Aliamphritea spongicola]